MTAIIDDPQNPPDLFVHFNRLPDELNNDFFDALCKGNVLKVGLLLNTNPECATARDYIQHDPDIDLNGRSTENAHTPALEIAAATMPTHIVERMINLGARVTATGKFGNTALHAAALNGKIDTIDLLLERGAHINAPRVDGTYPLHYALDACDVRTAQYLLDKGAMIGDADAVLRNMLSANAAHNDFKRVADFKGTIYFLVEECGADVNIGDATQVTPLMYAAAQQYTGAIDTLIACGARIDATDDIGKTPLHHLTEKLRWRQEPLAALMLLAEHGADPRVCDNSGKTPRDIIRYTNSYTAETTFLQQLEKARDLKDTIAHAQHTALHGIEKPIRLQRQIKPRR